MAKSKSSNLAKFKKSTLLNGFIKANSGLDFLSLETKKAFIHLEKTFTDAPIPGHFDLKHHIWIKSNSLEYTIGEVLS